MRKFNLAQIIDTCHKAEKGVKAGVETLRKKKAEVITKLSFAKTKESDLNALIQILESLPNSSLEQEAILTILKSKRDQIQINPRQPHLLRGLLVFPHELEEAIDWACMETIKSPKSGALLQTWLRDHYNNLLLSPSIPLDIIPGSLEQMLLACSIHLPICQRFIQFVPQWASGEIQISAPNLEKICLNRRLRGIGVQCFHLVAFSSEQTRPKKNLNMNGLRNSLRILKEGAFPLNNLAEIFTEFERISLDVLDQEELKSTLKSRSKALKEKLLNRELRVV